VLLLNKADLLPDALRLEWAKYFTSKGIAFHFWSAKAAEAALKDKAAAAVVPVQRASVADDDDSDDEDDDAAAPHERPAAAAEATGAAGAAGTLAVAEAELRQYNCEVLGREELLERLEATATAVAAAAAAGDEEGGGRKDAHVVVGFVGYPNVGKSSTLNALIGEKKASVAVRLCCVPIGCWIHRGDPRVFVELERTPLLSIFTAPGILSRRPCSYMVKACTSWVGFALAALVVVTVLCLGGRGQCNGMGRICRRHPGARSTSRPSI
jgi:hypothetical protein